MRSQSLTQLAILILFLGSNPASATHKLRKQRAVSETSADTEAALLYLQSQYPTFQGLPESQFIGLTDCQDSLAQNADAPSCKRLKSLGAYLKFGWAPNFNVYAKYAGTFETLKG